MDNRIKTKFSEYVKESKESKLNESHDVSIDEVKLFITDYASYNSGESSGKWYELSDYSDSQELLTAVEEEFARLDEEKPLGSPREEIMVTDYEGIPEEFYSEAMSEDGFNKIYDLIEYAEDNNLESFENIDDNLVSIWNNYCDEINSSDQIYTLDEDTVKSFLGEDVIDVFSMGLRSEFNWSDDWFMSDRNGNLKSISNPSTEIEESDLFNHISKNL